MDHFVYLIKFCDMDNEGSSLGRSFASKIRATAVGLVASAPNPYTVSVGKATIPPLLIMAAASEICLLKESMRDS